MTDSYTPFFSAVHLAPNLDVCTDNCHFDDQVVGVETTTERNPVIDSPINVSFPRSASTKLFRYDSSNRGSRNL